MALMDVPQFKKLPIFGILRGISEKEIGPLTQSILSSGLRVVEITMNTPQAPKLIRKMIAEADECFSVGAGTVLGMEDLKQALDAGASFIVCPIFIPSVVDYCVRNAVPVFPGALTPQEIYTAWKAGVTMVKVFPAKVFGPEYIKEVKAPLNDIEILACGGISSLNIQDYFNAGVSAVAFGASIFRPEWIRQGNFDHIGQCIRELISKIERKIN